MTKPSASPPEETTGMTPRITKAHHILIDAIAQGHEDAGLPNADLLRDIEALVRQQIAKGGESDEG